jgi:hypothetical protein
MADSTPAKRRTAVLTCIALTSVALAIGVVVGVFAVRPASPYSALPFEIPVHAAAAYGQDNYLIATGPVDAGLEGLFFLDALTGELKCAVLNERTKKFMATYNRKILPDFGKDVKNPRFMMVTGQADVTETAGGGSSRFADSVIYVIEITSGQANCYGFQIPANLKSSTKSFSGELMGLDRIELRKKP